MSNDSAAEYARQIADSLPEWQTAELGEDGQAMPDALDWLADSLDYRYVMDSTGEIIEAQVLVAFGGPTAWVHLDGSERATVHASWWSAEQTATTRHSDAIRELGAGVIEYLESSRVR
jgi:hypothetical protein